MIATLIGIHVVWLVESRIHDPDTKTAIETTIMIEELLGHENSTDEEEPLVVWTILSMWQQ